MERINFTDITFNELVYKLGKETGIDYKYYRRKFLEKRIKSRMIRLDLEDPQDYLNYISKQPSEIEKFLSGFTINVTNFFRNLEVFERIQKVLCNALGSLNNGRKMLYYANEKNKNGLYKAESILTEEILKSMSLFEKLRYPKKKPNSELRIWSCPCATGEEPYSLAIMLDQLKEVYEYFPRTKLVASDIDLESIQKAYSGFYSEESMKEIPPLYKSMYFYKVLGRFGDRYRICDYIKDKVEFVNEDVIKGHKKSLIYDIIFCRYLFIYINRPMRDKILKLFDQHMHEGALLVLGKTETLFNSYMNFKLIDSRNHIYIKKTTKN
ncbi:MAG: CheR family methyltransferase [Candidatus Hodarchaeota archaeon]